MKKTALPFTTLLHNSVLLVEQNLFLFVLVVTIPLLATYLCYWLLLGVVLTDLQNVHSLVQLQQLFSWGSSTPYLIIGSVLFIVIMTLLGLIGTPIVATYNAHITWRTIVPRTFHYTLPYIGLTMLIGLCLLGVLVLSYAVSTIIVAVAGLINTTYLDPTYNVVIPLVPNLLFFVAGIFFIFAPYQLVSQEHGNAWIALLTSVRLVKRHFWTVVIRTGIIIALLAILASVLQFIPLVGIWLALILSNIILTAFNYTLYQDLINI